MDNKRNLRKFQTYLRPKQLEALYKLQDRVEKEYDVTLPASEFIRDAIDQFIDEKHDEKSLKSYMEKKGW